ncbi:MAG TPA: 3D domain-containing protein [Pyrinomonadaceae bacterium]|jgi:3D (Asp-Asp-Asp) domain-containing protein|nr:3D domain-containing protein [Pyrinomonadaceae bacterium]
MQMNNRFTHLASLGKMDSSALPLTVTPEEAASMPIEAVEEGLRDLGLDPHQPLPEMLRLMSADHGGGVLDVTARHKRQQGELSERLLDFFKRVLPSPARLGSGGPYGKLLSRYALIFVSTILIMIFAGDLVEHGFRYYVRWRQEKAMIKVAPPTRPLNGLKKTEINSTPEEHSAIASFGFVTAAARNILPTGTRVLLEEGRDEEIYVVAGTAANERGRPSRVVKGPIMVEAKAVLTSKSEKELEALMKEVQQLSKELSWVKAKRAETQGGPIYPSSEEQTLTASFQFTATAYSLHGRTASGRLVTRGLIAADRRVLPIGTRVRIEAGSYTGEYVVADTGGAVRGRKIDIWVPNTCEAMRFGRRPIKLTVLTRTRPRTSAQRTSR